MTLPELRVEGGFPQVEESSTACATLYRAFHCDIPNSVVQVTIILYFIIDLFYFDFDLDFDLDFYFYFILITFYIIKMFSCYSRLGFKQLTLF